MANIILAKWPTELCVVILYYTESCEANVERNNNQGKRIINIWWLFLILFLLICSMLNHFADKYVKMIASLILFGKNGVCYHYYQLCYQLLMFEHEAQSQSSKHHGKRLFSMIINILYEEEWLALSCKQLAWSDDLTFRQTWPGQERPSLHSIQSHISWQVNVRIHFF